MTFSLKTEIFDLLTPPMNLVAAAKAAIEEINIEHARQLKTTALLIDVREVSEYRCGHIPGARNVPRGMLEFQIHNLVAETCDDDDLACRQIIVYCASGGRSALAAQCLQSMGYTSVKSLAGGIEAWAAANLELQTLD